MPTSGRRAGERGETCFGCLRHDVAPPCACGYVRPARVDIDLDVAQANRAQEDRVLERRDRGRVVARPLRRDPHAVLRARSGPHFGCPQQTRERRRRRGAGRPRGSMLGGLRSKSRRLRRRPALRGRPAGAAAARSCSYLLRRARLAKRRQRKGLERSRPLVVGFGDSDRFDRDSPRTTVDRGSSSASSNPAEGTSSPASSPRCRLPIRGSNTQLPRRDRSAVQQAQSGAQDRHRRPRSDWCCTLQRAPSEPRRSPITAAA